MDDADHWWDWLRGLWRGADGEIDMSERRCTCTHFWTEHDVYGCQIFGCPCTRIDRHTHFDKATRSAVPDQDE